MTEPFDVTSPEKEGVPSGPGAGDRREPGRFAFGRNWASFLRVLDEERIAEAERSLTAMLGAERIAGATFLDVGSGSGLFSLAAMRLGARRVHSFDFDPASVACTQELRRRYFPEASHWTIARASALDGDYVRSLGTWNVVYSWGVLHHTGGMWDALGQVAGLVDASGVLFISIYNDQGPISAGWRAVKQFYNRGAMAKAAVVSAFVPYFVGRGLVVDLARRRSPLTRYRDYRRTRGMSMVHDWIDWLGGFPFEVAKPEEVFHFYRQRGFTLEKLTTCGGRLGCNEFVFHRSTS